MGARVEWAEDENGSFRATVHVGDRTFSAAFHGDFRSPYSPWVIQVRKSAIELWEDGTAVSFEDRARIWAALQQHRCPAEAEYQEG